ncbi:integrase catalytic domain-containing protein [Trichonephila inaurata madagascariensis]|uniref:Integrase catalytic domain-containing protein n=1 Tax=Trichonephila inaurata madagascariensis TaxID=2747483 RepID=A0A8X6WQD2_9ARAC|nr:integrase catalytic domain-containing protein [Trichonephila inaurata madagascariensis]
MLAETWLGNDERLSIPNFDCCVQFKRPSHRAAGVARDLSQTEQLTCCVTPHIDIIYRQTSGLAIVGIWSPVLNIYVRGKVILDSASQSHFMTLQFASKLGLEKKRKNPRNFLIVSTITDFVPSTQPNFRIKNFNDMNRSILADPSFDETGKIHMIKGAELFYQIVKDGRKDEELPTLGNSLILAQKRLHQTIKKLDRDPYMHKLYCEFFEEHESLAHIQRIPDNCYSPISYYLPHHGVFKSQNNSTKLRVVFDGSAPTTSGQSLNDILLSGRVQGDVFNIMLRVNPSDLSRTPGTLVSGPSSAMEEIIDNSRQNDLSSSEKELYLTELKTVTYTNLILSSDNNFINQ